MMQDFRTWIICYCKKCEYSQHSRLGILPHHRGKMPIGWASYPNGNKLS